MEFIQPGIDTGREPEKKIKKNIKRKPAIDWSRARRELKIQAEIRTGREEISGVEGKELKKIIKTAYERLKLLTQTEEGKRNETVILELAKKLGIDKEKLMNEFNQGLKYNIKAAYKAKLIDNTSIDEDTNKIHINTIIGAYVLNFRSSLKRFEKQKQKGRDSTPKFILEIAKRMYLLSPKTLENIRNKYKDVDDWIINHFVFNNPEDPEEAIESCLQTVNDLRCEFSSEIEEGVIKEGEIKRFVVYNFKKVLKALETSPEQVLQLFQDLKGKRKSIEDKSEAKRKRKKISSLLIQDLRERYKDDEDIKPWMIKHFALRNLKNPGKAIEGASKLIKHYKSKFPTISSAVIDDFVVYNPRKAFKLRDKDPEQVLQFFQNLEEKKRLAQETEEMGRLEKIDQISIKIMEQEKQRATVGLGEEESKRVEEDIMTAWYRKRQIVRRARQRLLQKKREEKNICE